MGWREKAEVFLCMNSELLQTGECPTIPFFQQFQCQSYPIELSSVYDEKKMIVACDWMTLAVDRMEIAISMLCQCKYIECTERFFVALIGVSSFPASWGMHSFIFVRCK